jgi:nucleoside-diphosphate-sugar epimerase
VDSLQRSCEDWIPPKSVRFENVSAYSWMQSCDEPFDEVYHFASAVGPVSLLREPGKIAKALVEDLYAVIDFCLRSGAKLLYASSSEVYGGTANDRPKLREDHWCRVPSFYSPRLEYAVGKLLDEIVVSNTPDLDTVIVRFFNVAGPRQGTDGGFVLPRFVRQALANEPLTVYDRGRYVRSFTHVGDVIQGSVLALRKGMNKSIYNLGNPQNRVLICDLARKVIDVTESKSKIVFVDPQVLWGPLFVEAGDKVPDIEKAKAELGWKPKHNLGKIIEDVVNAEKQCYLKR